MKKNTGSHLAFASAIALMSHTAISAEFSACPTDAFLIQDKLANLYGVQLATGFYEKLSPLEWGQEKMNALAFNTFDRYLYAYNYYYNTIVQIDNEFNVTPLWVTNMTNSGFYVGDIALSENAFYLYRPGSSFGLYRISLNKESNDYLDLQLKVPSSTLNLAIYDLAFHPNNGFAYSVDKWGNLWQIDVQTGNNTKLSNVGESGTFGAVYFDVTGNLYISRNSDGSIFRINTNWNYPKAEFFAFGPSSSNNDGARCALAPIISTEQPTTDFGDAPESYGTSIDNNGARHQNSSNLHLGNNITLEPNAWAENGISANDNDGINFVTGLELGDVALIELQASESGYVNGWIDWNRNGVFDSDEKILEALPVTTGNQVVMVEVPNWASAGDTWSRFRISSLAVIGPQGGVPDGEVEDHKVTISNANVSTNFYPSAGSWATLAFEDNWPLEGDYDLNDLVVHYRLSTQTRNDNLINVKIEGKIVAMGASYHNGLAFRLQGLSTNDVNEAYIEYRINDIKQPSPLEANRSEAILILAADLWDYVTPGEECKYYRSEAGCGSKIQMHFSLNVVLNSNVAKANLISFPFDPFIFSSEGQQRGYLFGEAPDRRWEVHLKNQAPTEAFQMDFFNRGNDDSDTQNGRYFVTKNGMPWALNIPYPWRHPKEYIDVKYAYPNFHDHIESAGTRSLDWFVEEQGNFGNIFTD